MEKKEKSRLVNQSKNDNTRKNIQLKILNVPTLFSLLPMQTNLFYTF